MKTKKIIAFILTFCLMLGSLSLQGISSVTGNAADNGVMRDNMTAQDYADEMGLGINLGNTMEAYDATNCTSLSYTWPPVKGSNTPRDYETLWGAVVTTQEIIDGMRDSGFNTIRIPVFWGNMMENDGEYNISDKYIARVKEIVDYCRNAGVYVVINIHHFDEFIIRRNTKEKSAEIFKKIWTQIAEYFKDYSDYLVFEGFNEYLGGGQIDNNDEIPNLPESEGYDWTNTMNQVFVDAVRATGGNNAKRMLIASGYWTNIDKTTNSAFKMPTDKVEDRLMVSVHYVDNALYWSYRQIGGKNWIEYSKSQLELLKNAFTSKNIPVFIGETTSIYTSDHFSKSAIVETTYEALDYMLRLIKSYGFVPVLWDTNDNFYSRTEYRIKLTYNNSVINKLSKELEDGTFTAPENPTRPSSSTSSDTTTNTTSNTKPTAAPQVKVPTQAKLTKLKVRSKKKGKINVVWGKVSGAKGYEVQVSKFKNFKKLILKKTTPKTKLVIKNKKIKSKRIYFVRVRAYTTYKNANGVTKRVNSKWNYVLRKVKVK